MNKWWRYPGQFLAYLLFIAFIGYLSVSPAHVHLQPGQAVIKLSFSHGGKLKGKCRKRSQAELARLPRNMRQPLICPRERSPIDVEIYLNDKVLFRQQLQPSGLRKDGPATIYRRFHVAAGRYRLQAKLRDSIHSTGFNYVREATVTLKPAQVLVIDFNPGSGGFIFK